MNFNIAVLPGDYIGPEVVAESIKILKVIGKKYGHTFNFQEDAIGGAAIDKYGVPVRDETLEMCRKCDAILFGAAGGPKWETTVKRNRADTALVKVRKAFDLFANLRIIKVYPALENATNLKPEVIKGVDLIILRELTSGLYYGEPRGIVENHEGEKKGFNMMTYTEAEIERVLRVGFELARTRRKKLLSVEKSNVLETSLLWKQTALKLEPEYPDIELSHMYVDAAAQMLINRPKDIDVLVTENTFGDILSDEASELGGSMGMIPSASLARVFDGKAFGLYEPIHGSDPQNAGKDRDNPIAMILSAGLMLQYSCGLPKEGAVVEKAVENVLEKGYRTWDIFKGEGTEIGMSKMSDLIAEEIEKL